MSENQKEIQAEVVEEPTPQNENDACAVSIHAASQGTIMEEENINEEPEIMQQQEGQESFSDEGPVKTPLNPFTIITARTLTKKEQRKCQNKICKSEGVKVLKVTDSGPHNYLCDPCNSRFKDGDYCFYCHQIYFQYSDGTDWVMCDKCQKWIHCDCEEKFGDISIKMKMVKYPDLPYFCPRCKPTKQITSKKVSSAQSKDQKQYRDYKDKNRFNKRNDCILNGYGFYWKLKPEQIQSDLQRLRKECS